uniref:PH domain-containing protein n=1 Tax=Taenia asiatica TaxID=60517 RepID=A0A0R3VYW1_TAEAS
LQDLMVEEAESPMSFTVYAGNRCFVVAAPSEWQRDRWLEDISRAILAAKTTLPSVSALTSNASAFLGLEASISPAAGTADNTEDEEPKSERSETLSPWLLAYVPSETLTEFTNNRFQAEDQTGITTPKIVFITLLGEENEILKICGQGRARFIAF